MTPHFTIPSAMFLIVALPGSLYGQPTATQAQPNILPFGTVCVGATVEGSVRISVKGDEVVGASIVVDPPDFIGVRDVKLGTHQTRRIGSVIYANITVVADTRSAGAFGGFLTVKLADQIVKVPVTLVVKKRPPNATRLLVVESPFDDTSTLDGSLFDGWLELIRSGNYDVHYLDVLESTPVLRELQLSDFDVILLGENGLLSLSAEEVQKLTKFAEDGGRVVVAASDFYDETVAKANELLTEFGLQMRAEELPGREFRIKKDQLVDDELCVNIESLDFFRASPIEVTDKTIGKVLVPSPSPQGAGFVAVGRRGKGEVVALGQSLWWHWVRQGQDGNNDILMKNMITKRAR